MERDNLTFFGVLKRKIQKFSTFNSVLCKGTIYLTFEKYVQCIQTDRDNLWHTHKEDSEMCKQRGLRFLKYEYVLPCVAVCCSVLQCVAVCCSVLQCIAVCCSGLL